MQAQRQHASSRGPPFPLLLFPFPFTSPSPRRLPLSRRPPGRSCTPFSPSTSTSTSPLPLSRHLPPTWPFTHTLILCPSPCAAPSPSPATHLAVHAHDSAHSVLVGLKPHKPVGTLAVQLHLSHSAIHAELPLDIGLCGGRGGERVKGRDAGGQEKAQGRRARELKVRREGALLLRMRRREQDWNSGGQRKAGVRGKQGAEARKQQEVQQSRWGLWGCNAAWRY